MLCLNKWYFYVRLNLVFMSVFYNYFIFRKKEVMYIYFVIVILMREVVGVFFFERGEKR